MADTPITQDSLAKLLDNEDVFAMLVSLSPDALSVAQRDRLRQLHLHFNDENIATQERVASKKRKLSSQGSQIKKGYYAAILKRKQLMVGTEILEHIQLHGTEPYLFLNAKWSAYKCGLSEFYAGNAGDALVASYNYARDTQDKIGITKCQWLFFMLLFYDIVKVVWPNAGTRIGELMVKDLGRMLAGLSEEARGEINVAGAAHDIQNWFYLGRKLNILCSKLGAGCLFPLADVLSEDFIKNRMTASGEAYDNVIIHLQDLGIERYVEATRVGELGRKLRAYLSRPFQEWHSQHGQHDHVSSDTEAQDGA